MKAFAWSNSLGPKLDFLMASADKQNIKIDVIGLGYQVDPSFWFKIDALDQAVRGLPGDEMILCTDAYDVLYLDSAGAIEAKFRSFGVPLIFCAERSYFHQLRSYQTFFERTPHGSPYKYLNSGALIGYAEALRDMFCILRGYDRTGPMTLKVGHVCDQTLFGKYCAENPAKVLLDHRCRIFWCMAGEWDDVNERAFIQHGRILNGTTRTLPSILHVPWHQKYMPVLRSLYERLVQRPSSVLGGCEVTYDPQQSKTYNRSVASPPPPARRWQSPTIKRGGSSL